MRNDGAEARRGAIALRRRGAWLWALGAFGAAALGSATASADGAVPTITIVRGDASIEVDASALGVAPVGDGAAVTWDASRLRAQCESLGDALGLAPAFEGDVEIEDDAVTAIAPIAGEEVDCGALALDVERRLAAAGPWVIQAPILVREPRVSAASVDALASDVRALLEAPVELEITFRGARAGAVTITPDEARDAVRVHLADDPPRLEATLESSQIEAALAPILSPLGEPAKDADFAIGDDGAVRVIPGRRGVRVDGAALFAQAAEAAKTPAKAATVSATKGEPALSTKKAQDLGIKNLVATFTTKHPTKQPRVVNIHKIATLLDGAIVEPGERFSMNRHVGKRTAKKGFVLAPSIGEGEFVETIGGGISQVATTLYNAVFDAGYAVVSRKPHTFYFPRYPMGVEATLSWPRPDFVFRNDSKAGVLLKTSFTDDSITVKLYGDNGGRTVKRVVSKQFAPTDPRVDYEPDDTLALDKTKVKDEGTKGFSVKAGRDITFPDGTKKHEERKVVYHGKPRVLYAHPCSIPKGEKGHRKKGCPKPGDVAATSDKDEKDDKSDKKKSDDKSDKKDKKSDDKVEKKSDDKKGDDKKPASKSPDDKAIASAPDKKSDDKKPETVPAKLTDKDAKPED
ncbi:MAG: VanW family protein [Polyangiaceae bacterium]